MSEPRVPRPLPLPRFAIPIGLLVAVLAVAAFAAVACRSESGGGPDVSSALGVVAPIQGSGKPESGQQESGQASAGDEEELEEFVPSEEVSADKSVSFPVDI